MYVPGCLRSHEASSESTSIPDTLCIAHSVSLTSNGMLFSGITLARRSQNAVEYQHVSSIEIEEACWVHGTDIPVAQVARKDGDMWMAGTGSLISRLTDRFGGEVESAWMVGADNKVVTASWGVMGSVARAKWPIAIWGRAKSGESMLALLAVSLPNGPWSDDRAPERSIVGKVYTITRESMLGACPVWAYECVCDVHGVVVARAYIPKLLGFAEKDVSVIAQEAIRACVRSGRWGEYSSEARVDHCLWCKAGGNWVAW